MRIIKIVILFVASVALIEPISAQEKYRFDFTKVLFKGIEDEAKQRVIFTILAKSIEMNIASYEPSAYKVRRLFVQMDSLQYLYNKHSLYLFMLYAVNTKKEEPLSDRADLDEGFNHALNLFTKWANKISGKDFNQFIDDLPSLSIYRFAHYSLSRYAVHTPSEKLEKEIQTIRDNNNSQFYQQLVNKINYGVVTAGKESFNLKTELGKAMNHPDAIVRDSAFAKFMDAFSQQSEPMAKGYINLVIGIDSISRLKNYSGRFDEVCFDNYLNPDKLLVLYKEIQSHSYLARSFDSINKKYSSSPKATISNNSQIAKFSIEKASAMIKKAFLPFGKKYSKELADLLNPENGRIDILNGSDRIGLEGTASYTPLETSIFFANNFEGYLRNISILSHEAGHAIQGNLMWNNKVSQFYGSAPAYLSESFGKFNELVTLHYLMENAKKGGLRTFYYQQLLKTLLNIFYASPESIIEYNLYSGIISGSIKNADDLDSVTYNTGLKLDSRYKKIKELKNTWMEREEFYVAPLLKTVEPYASLLAVKYFELYLKQDRKFTESYIKLLERGLDDEPNELLKKYLSIDINSPDFLNSCMSFLEEQIDAYKNYIGSLK